MSLNGQSRTAVVLSCVTHCKIALRLKDRRIARRRKQCSIWFLLADAGLTFRKRLQKNTWASRTTAAAVSAAWHDGSPGMKHASRRHAVHRRNRQTGAIRMRLDRSPYESTRVFSRSRTTGHSEAALVQSTSRSATQFRSNSRVALACSCVSA